MKKTTSFALAIGCFFGVIGYVVCNFFVGRLFAALLGVFGGVIFFVAFYVIGNIITRKQAKILSRYGANFLFAETVNHYSGGGISNGILFLQDTQLSFIETEKRQYKIDCKLDEIDHVDYGKMTNFIPGIIITMRDGRVEQFSLAEKEFRALMESINIAQLGKS